MESLVLLSLVLLSLVLPALLFLWDRKEPGYLEGYDDVQPAIDGEIDLADLRTNPHKLEKLAEKVSSVGIIIAPINSSSTMGGGHIHSCYQAFVIDINGVSHTFFEAIKWEPVASKARWLAARLDVPLQDGVFGEE